jgi:hypothetical protein
MNLSRRPRATGSEPFVNRGLLRSSTLDHAWSSLDRLDALHVVDTHGHHGVADGLGLAIVDDGQGLDVTPGAAFTPCGHLIVVACRTRFDRPPMPGPHALWLRRDGVIVGQPYDRPRPSGAVFLGRAVASQARYWQSVDQSGRTSIPRPVPPQVASSRLTLDLREIDIDRSAQMLTTTIDTTNGAFESAPLYFVTIAVRDRLAEGHVQRITGWYTTISSPGPSSFVLQVHLLAEDSIWDDLEEYKALSEFLGGLVSLVVFDVVWIGVNPRRPGTSPIDPYCVTSAITSPPPSSPPTFRSPKGDPQ